jgi:FMN phosphatase YigB (HAD superfamily)
MKYIFDFDDVLFNNTAQFKKHMFQLIAEVGVSENEARAYYFEVREKEFSLRKFINTLFLKHNINKKNINKLYEAIMLKSSKFTNIALIKFVRKIGKENCYIVTNGDKKFNQDKVNYSGIGPLFKKIYIVPGTKKEIVKKICTKNKNEKIFFIDDKMKFIEDIDLKKCPNLTTILYKNQTIF